MNLFTPAELTANYARIGAEKSQKPLLKLLPAAILAGMIIAFGAAVANTATHAISNVSVARIISGLLFPFGLGIVMLTGTELFTGNVMIAISVLNKSTTVTKMLRNWIIVYLGNFAGALFLAMCCAWFGQLDYSGGQLAVFTVRIAAAKCNMPMQNVFCMGILCNILVCAGVLCSLSAKDTAGRILGAYIPVAFFVVCGFEHCVANMFYVPAGILAMRVPEYATLVSEAGINTANLTWASFLFRNLLPATLGNIIGGVAIGTTMWYSHISTKQ